MAIKQDVFSPAKNRASIPDILAAVKNPLLFFALALLIFESILTIVLYSGNLTSDQNFYIVIFMCSIFLIVIGIVAWLVYNAPDSLMMVQQVKKELQTVSEKMQADVQKVKLRQNLLEIKHELSAFDVERKPFEDCDLSITDRKTFDHIDQLYNAAIAIWICGCFTHKTDSELKLEGTVLYR